MCSSDHDILYKNRISAIYQYNALFRKLLQCVLDYAEVLVILSLFLKVNTSVQMTCVYSALCVVTIIDPNTKDS